ncbi:DNA polymerase I [Pelagibacterales bacterium SAG-MED38]|nr:DNA polymerase I [Pelagibacterales bacterium SAG-MED38]MBD1141786.1 DNA polymerase I [Pelagibacterales bacterium SAG-MED32]
MVLEKKNPEVKFETKNIEESKVEKNESGNTSSDKEIAAKNINTKYILIDNIENLEELKSTIYEIGHFVYDVETDSLNILEANLIGISICYGLETSYYIPFNHINELNQRIKKQIKIEEFLKIFKPIMEDSSIIKIGHNIKYDNAILMKYGVGVIGCDDTMLMSFISDAGINRHGMDDLAKIHLNKETIKYKEVVGSGKSQITFDKVDLKNALKYAAEDADITYKLYLFFKKRINHEKNNYIYSNIEKPLIDCIQTMELNGIKVDKEYLKKLSTDFSKRILKLESKIYKDTGTEFNIASPKQLSDVLFDKLKLKPPKKTRTGEKSTGIDVLEDLAYGGNKVAETIIEWRQLSKLKNTYTEALQTHIIKSTGRIHTSYAMASTSTGRLASSDPNLQNIPIRTKEGRSIRKAFIPDKGQTIFAADYSQIELRVLAHMADVSQLKDAFNNNEDIHQLTASEIFNVKHKDVSKDLRRKAKAVNFGIIYGISAFGLAKQLSISNYEASDFIKEYFKKFSGIKEYMENTKEFCRKNGYVETLCGRKCFFPRIKDKNFALRSFQERAAINAPIQGTAADIIKLAMIKINDKIKATNECKMLLQVHDELIFEIKNDKLKKYRKIIVAEMENALKPKFDLSVPLSVDSNNANNWSDAH